LYSIAASNATIERLFSNMGWHYAVKRKRLNQTKVDKMSRICYHDRQNQRIKRRKKVYADLPHGTSTMTPIEVDEDIENNTSESEGEEDSQTFNVETPTAFL
jgi:hypothetical protein